MKLRTKHRTYTLSWLGWKEGLNIDFDPIIHVEIETWKVVLILVAVAFFVALAIVAISA